MTAGTAVPDPEVAIRDGVFTSEKGHRTGCRRFVSAPGAKIDDVPWTSTPLVGRSTELAALLSAVDDARTRRAGAVLLSGDAGVGKTRLLDEVANGAHERGFGVLVGHCT